MLALKFTVHLEVDVYLYLDDDNQAGDEYCILSSLDDDEHASVSVGRLLTAVH